MTLISFLMLQSFLYYTNIVSQFFLIVFIFAIKDDNIASLFFALYNLQHTMWDYSEIRELVFVFRAMVVKNAIFVFSLPAWKRDFHQIISRLWARMRGNNDLSHISLPCISPATSLVSVIKQENDVGDQYFNSLAGLWDNRLLVNNWQFRFHVHIHHWKMNKTMQQEIKCNNCFSNSFIT